MRPGDRGLCITAPSMHWVCEHITRVSMLATSVNYWMRRDGRLAVSLSVLRQGRATKITNLLLGNQTAVSLSGPPVLLNCSSQLSRNMNQEKKWELIAKSAPLFWKIWHWMRVVGRLKTLRERNWKWGEARANEIFPSQEREKHTWYSEMNYEKKLDFSRKLTVWSW
jgi:hypothetical protein